MNRQDVTLFRTRAFFGLTYPLAPICVSYIRNEERRVLRTIYTGDRVRRMDVQWGFMVRVCVTSVIYYRARDCDTIYCINELRVRVLNRGVFVLSFRDRVRTQVFFVGWRRELTILSIVVFWCNYTRPSAFVNRDRFCCVVFRYH